jgi:hypothetical protein
MLDRETFHRLHAACTACDDNVVVRASDLRSLLDAGAEIDRQCTELQCQCESMTRELAAAKTQLVELADRQPAAAPQAAVIAQGFSTPNEARAERALPPGEPPAPATT